jgi:hypothetical protein
MDLRFCWVLSGEGGDRIPEAQGSATYTCVQAGRLAQQIAYTTIQ